MDLICHEFRGFRDLSEFFEDMKAQYRVFLDFKPFVFGQPSFFKTDVFGDQQHADVMQQRADADFHYLLPAVLRRRRDIDREQAHVEHVVVQVFAFPGFHIGDIDQNVFIGEVGLYETVHDVQDHAFVNPGPFDQRIQDRFRGRNRVGIRGGHRAHVFRRPFGSGHLPGHLPERHARGHVGREPVKEQIVEFQRLGAFDQLQRAFLAGFQAFELRRQGDFSGRFSLFIFWTVGRRGFNFNLLQFREFPGQETVDLLLLIFTRLQMHLENIPTRQGVDVFLGQYHALRDEELALFGIEVPFGKRTGDDG